MRCYAHRLEDCLSCTSGPVLNFTDGCDHDVEDLGNGWGRCRKCGDDSFPTSHETAYGLPSTEQAVRRSLTFCDATKALADCLRYPQDCEDLADYMHDMGNDARQWLDNSKAYGTRADIESHAKMVRENDLAENLLRALAKLGREATEGAA